MEHYFLFVGPFDWGNAETQTLSISPNHDGFALAESQTRKSDTLTTLQEAMHQHVTYLSSAYIPSTSVFGFFFERKLFLLPSAKQRIVSLNEIQSYHTHYHSQE